MTASLMYNESAQFRKIKAFQALVEEDIKRLKENHYKNDVSTRLKISEIKSVLRNAGFNENDIKSIIGEWIEKGLIIDYGDSSYRTIYGELIYRLAHIAIKPGPSLPLVFHVKTIHRKLPNFNDPDYCFPGFCKRRSLDIEKLFIKTVGFQVARILFKALRKIRRYKGLSLWQFNCLKRILEDYRSAKFGNRVYVLMAPVSSGKTLVFTLASIAFALKNILSGTDIRPVAIFVYPRRSLATDQLRRLWELVYKINEVLVEEGYSNRIMIGIDDGATPRRVKDPIEFRCECPHNDKNPVIVDDGYVICKYGKHKEILATKEKVWEKKPHILLTNLWIIHQGLMDYERRELFDNAILFVFDEIHEYYDDKAAHLAYVINRIVDARKRKKLHLPAFVASSATIAQDPNKVKRFIESRFQGLEVIYENDMIYENLEEKMNTIDRLEIHAFVAPNPYVSGETVFQEVINLLATWAYATRRYNGKGYKVIGFLDNVSEVERLYNFISRIIVEERAEFADHIIYCKKDSSYEDPYCWIPLLTGRPKSTAIKVEGKEDIFCKVSEEVKVAIDNFTFTNKDLAKSIQYHHGERSVRERKEVEIGFKGDKYNCVLATSTLELGIDIDNVSVIVQYKVPPTPESYIQRVGRAGRRADTFYIALGILVLSNSPRDLIHLSGSMQEKLTTLDLPNYRLLAPTENIAIKNAHMNALFYDILSERKYLYSDFNELVIKAKELKNLRRKNTKSFIEFVEQTQLLLTKIRTQNILKALEEAAQRLKLIEEYKNIQISLSKLEQLLEHVSKYEELNPEQVEISLHKNYDKAMYLLNNLKDLCMKFTHIANIVSKDKNLSNVSEKILSHIENIEKSINQLIKLLQDRIGELKQQLEY